MGFSFRYDSLSHLYDSCCGQSLIEWHSLSLAIPRERVWWSESSKMMMIMRMKRFMFDECVGGCRGRVLIDIFDHTHCTRILHCLQCCCHILGSFAALSSLPPWWSISVQGLQLPYAMYVASIARSSAVVSHWRSISHFFRLAFSWSL